ncbi:hypothetical protein O3P69_006596 [Scylla paramamosain]|uniref:Uncharacterized protein n=1 Tax=Scylla paramamosain TaxID=85552 RepID=A0AAW0U846_SCYPA
MRQSEGMKGAGNDGKLKIPHVTTTTSTTTITTTGPQTVMSTSFRARIANISTASLLLITRHQQEWIVKKLENRHRSLPCYAVPPHAAQALLSARGFSFQGRHPAKVNSPTHDLGDRPTTQHLHYYTQEDEGDKGCGGRQQEQGRVRWKTAGRRHNEV